MPNRTKIIHCSDLFKNFGIYSSMQAINMYIHKKNSEYFFTEFY